MNEQYIDNLAENAVALKKEADATNLKTAVLNYMSVLAAGFSDDKLPNGMTAEQAAESVINGASYYVHARESQRETPMELTMDELRDSIAENIRGMTGEQAVRYLAMLQVMYRYFMSTDENASAAAVEEYNRILIANSYKPLQEQVDDLIDNIDITNLHSVLSFAERIPMHAAAQSDEQVKQFVEAAAAHYAELEDIAICGAVMYGEVVREQVADFSPQADPGIVTAVTGAMLDAIHLSALKSKGMQMKEFIDSLSDIERGLAAALAICTGALVTVWAATLAPEIAIILANIGMETAAAEIVTKLGYYAIVAWQALSMDKYTYEYGIMIKAAEMLFGKEQQAEEIEEGGYEPKRVKHKELHTNLVRE